MMNTIITLNEENRKLKLDLLKQQIPPHFVFNSLNNIYSMVQKIDKDVASYVMKFSELIRYSIYESINEKVSLKKEINFLSNYIGLERVRHNPRRVRIEFIQIGEVSNIGIPPLMLLELVENAFKHGINKSHEMSSIFVKIKVKSKRLILIVLNSTPIQNILLKGNIIGGIGLKNLKNRLELFYSKKHTLTLQIGENRYISVLTIDLG
ncbi:hypothetical protein GCM10023091_07640 [Ravibacter arvi]|uniref:Signal transduction histidine kinase internal region domain-containing protein n=1 Tax=Ravibacter arvi TaxID=2051041 RepID=A0ABP8LPQ6_9BACT